MSQINLANYKPSNQQSRETNTGNGLGKMMELLNKDISLFGNSLSDKKKERYYSELGILISAGIDIKTALEIIVDEQTNSKDKLMYARIKDVVISGSSLSEAMNSTEKFSPYEYYSIQIGEESGRLTEVIQELTKFYTNKIKQKRQVINSLSYPGIVMVTAFSAIFFMMKYIVPMFADIFKRFKTDLPYLTKLIIHISDVISNYFFLFLITFLVITVFFYLQRKKDWYRKYNAMILLRIPIIGNMVKKIYLGRFSQAMTLLLSAKTPLVTSIELVRNMIGFYPVETSLRVVQDQIVRGKSLYESLSEYDFYDKRMLSLIKVAEEVNKLDVIFDKLSKQYEEEVQSQANVLGTLLEPVLIIFLGLMVAVILIAMYLPLFKLSTSIGM